jgi:hypothetical protein
MSTYAFGRIGDRPPLGLRYSRGPTPFSPGWTDFWRNQFNTLRGGITPPLGLRAAGAADTGIPVAGTTPVLHPVTGAMHPLLASGGPLGRGGAAGMYGLHHAAAALAGTAPGTVPPGMPPGAVPPAYLPPTGGPPAAIGPPPWSPYLLGFMQGLGGT